MSIGSRNTQSRMMRIIYRILVLAVLILVWLGNASEVKAQKFIGKLIIGVNGSQIDGDQRSGYNQPGLLAGMGAAFPINDKWSFEPEVLYSQKGSRTSTDETDRGLSLIRFRLNYVELPLLVNYHLSDFWVFCGGFHTNFLLNAKVDPGDNRDYQDDTNRWRKFDLCSSAGIELRPYPWFAFNMRLTYSLLPANKLLGQANTQQVLVGISPGCYNNTVSVSARFILNPPKDKK